MHTEYNNLLVVVQGNRRCSPEIIDRHWTGFNLVWSVWDDDTIETHNPIIRNEKPKSAGVGNITLQSKGTLRGLEYAKEKGFTHVLKWRTDQYPTNAKQLVDLFDFDKINVLAKHNHDHVLAKRDHTYGYYVDYFMLGNVDDMIKIWSVENTHNIPYPEYEIKNRINTFGFSIKCICSYLTDDNDIIWTSRNNLKLNTYNLDKTFITLCG